MENKQTFLNRLNSELSPKELTRVRAAYIFAKFGHRAQKRKELDNTGKQLRYFEHVRRVALILIDECDVRDPDIIITALLHDCFEDTVDIDPAIVELFFGSKVCSNVLCLSKTANCNDNEYFNKLLRANSDVRLVKCCDRLDNLRSISGCDRDFIDKQVEETEKYLEELFCFRDNDSLECPDAVVDEIRELVSVLR